MRKHSLYPGCRAQAKHCKSIVKHAIRLGLFALLAVTPLLASALLPTGGTSTAEAANDQPKFTLLLAAAGKGDPEAQYRVGMMLNNGIGTERNLPAAFQWFGKAAESGDPLGAYKLGCYYGGQFKGVVPIDEVRAFHWKMVAAEAGYSLAQYDIGNAFGERGDYVQAVRWWERAANQGVPLALFNLSVSHMQGNGVPKDAVWAYAYFKLAKIVSEGRVSPKAQIALQELKVSMSSAEFDRAESIVYAWKADLSPVTKRAKAGFGH